MPIQLIVASGEPRFHDFVKEQLSLSGNQDVVSEHEEMGPNLSVRILHYLNINPQSAVLLDISGDAAQGMRVLEQMTQAVPGLYVILSAGVSGEDFLLRAMRLGGTDFLQQPLKRAEFSEAMKRLEQHLQRVHRQAPQVGRMYTFTGVKGGMGTTCKPGVGSPEGPASDPTCSDNADNDCDGLTDDADPDCQGNADGGVADASTDTSTGSPDGSSVDAGSDGRIATTDGAGGNGLDASDGGMGVGGASADGAAGAGAGAGTGSGGATAGAAGSRTGGVGGAAGNGGVAGSATTGSSEDAQGGCGCRVAQRSQRASWPVAAVLIGCVFARRRARRKDARRETGA